MTDTLIETIDPKRQLLENFADYLNEQGICFYESWGDGNGWVYIAQDLIDGFLVEPEDD